MNKSTNNSAPACAAEFFQYRYPPFADTYEIRQPFLSQAETLIVQRSLALVNQGKSLAIYGEAGAGKSMLIKSITQQLDSKSYRVATIPYGGMKPSAILREICEAFGIDLSGRKNLLPRLQKNFQPHADKPFPVIIIDDAHAMEKQSFIDLCSLLHDAQSRTAAAALILAGQTVLKKILQLDIFAPVRTRLACRFFLPKLNVDEAKEFVRFRLQVAEASANIFHEQAIESIAADCAGNRRTLMNLAALCLEEAARRQEKVVTADIVNMVSAEQTE
jgi:type II secretory pathway predicted ATPase ExeA